MLFDRAKENTFCHKRGLGRWRQHKASVKLPLLIGGRFPSDEVLFGREDVAGSLFAAEELLFILRPKHLEDGQTVGGFARYLGQFVLKIFRYRGRWIVRARWPFFVGH